LAEESAEPAGETINALKPGLATTRGLLLAISSPYARRGALFSAYDRNFGKDGAPALVWQGASREMNAAIAAQTVADALEEDAASAGAEWLAEFRRDIESFVSKEAVDAVTIPGRLELPPSPGAFRYLATVDPSGGSSDSMTLAIAHSERRAGQDVAVLDLDREAQGQRLDQARCGCREGRRDRTGGARGESHGEGKGAAGTGGREASRSGRRARGFARGGEWVLRNGPRFTTDALFSPTRERKAFRTKKLDPKAGLRREVALLLSLLLPTCWRESL
jgi:hypothetical protein